MRAKFVFENISFRKGRDPKDAIFGPRLGQVVCFDKPDTPNKKGYFRKSIYYILRALQDSSGVIKGYHISGLGDVVYYEGISGYPRFEKLGGQHHTAVRKDEVVGISGMDKEVFKKWMESEEGQKKKEYIEKWDKVVPFISEF